MRALRLLAAPLLALASVALAACAPAYSEGFLAGFSAGKRAMHAGRYDEAAQAYEQAAAAATRVKDRDEARLLEARALEEAGRWQEAQAVLKRIVAESPQGPNTPRADLDHAELEIRHGDVEKGYHLLEEAARRHPENGVTAPSIRRFVAHLAETQGELAALAWLRTQERPYAGTEQDQTIAYEEALCLDRLGRKPEAHDVFLACAKLRPYPRGPLTDDAYWQAAQMDQDLGRNEEAIAHLREMLSVIETRMPVVGKYDLASYERPRFPEAQIRIAEIYRDKIGDRKAARREFERADREHPTYRRRAYAVWSGARLALLDGDEGTACELAERLAGELAESRYAACAQALCPRLPPAKRACADYLLRDLRGEATTDPGD
ncbi:MAG: tetratricopeptide repeat protein [Byssovorax sp.]